MPIIQRYTEEERENLEEIWKNLPEEIKEKCEDCGHGHTGLICPFCIARCEELGRWSGSPCT